MQNLRQAIAYLIFLKNIIDKVIILVIGLLQDKKANW